MQAWSTEDQVLETLKKLSGGRRRLGNLDNAYLLKGDAPPPALVVEEDEEMHLQFGDTVHAGKDILSENPTPDLQGITELLRLVQSSDGEGENKEMTTNGQSSNCVIAISKGSILNPNVEKFIPKSASSSSSSNISENSSRSVEKTDDSPPEATANKLPEIVTEDLATKLKKEISDAAKSNSFELKKQKNVAIATLLRLYATNQLKPATDTVKLITPDYFENRSGPVNTQSEPDVNLLPSTSSSPHKSIISVTQTSSSSEVKSEPALSTQAIKKDQKSMVVVDPAIKKSINKVNQWLGEQPVHSSVQRQSPAVFLGPITYKAKEPPASKSPSIPDTDRQKVTKQSQPNEYKPTNYAADLKNKYVERIKSKELVKKRNMWTDLHLVLKEKEVLATQKLE